MPANHFQIRVDEEDDNDIDTFGDEYLKKLAAK
jgi:hypothetical protein